MSGAKVGDKWGGDYYLFRRIIPSRAIIRMGADHAPGVVHRACRNVRRAGAEHGIPTMISTQSGGPLWVKPDADTTSQEYSPRGMADTRATLRTWWECSNSYKSVPG